MKIKFSVIIGSYLAIGILHSEAQSLQERISAAQTDGSVDKLSSLASEAESLWTNNMDAYFDFQNKISAALEPLSKTNSAAMQELEVQAENVLGKQYPDGAHAENVSFKSKFSIAERLAKASISAPDIRSAEIQAKFLGQVRTAIIPNYHFKMEEMNVAPPVAPTNGFTIAGMNPAAISDPVARAAYEKAIAENAQRDDENDLQLHTLPDINKTLTTYFFDYVKVLFTQNSELKSQANNLATLAHLTENEKLQLQ
jgi:hypothetical protein